MADNPVDTTGIIAAIFTASMLHNKSVSHPDYITTYEQFLELLAMHRKKRKEEADKASVELHRKIGGALADANRPKRR